MSLPTKLKQEKKMVASTLFNELFGTDFQKTLAKEITSIVDSMLEDFSIQEIMKIFGFLSVENKLILSDEDEESSNPFSPSEDIVDDSFTVGDFDNNDQNEMTPLHCIFLRQSQWTYVGLTSTLLTAKLCDEEDKGASPMAPWLL